MKKIIQTVLYQFFIGLLLATTALISAQTPQKTDAPRGHVRVIGKSDGKAVTLRWAPDQAALWMLMRDHKYIVERAVLAQDSLVSQNPKFINLHANGFAVQPLAEWEKVSVQEPTFGPIAAQTLWGKDFITSIGKAQNLQNRAEEESNRFVFGMFCADNSAAVAEAMGLRWLDTYELRPNRTYIYRVYTTLPQQVFPTDTGYAIVRIANITPLPVSPQPTARAMDGAVQIGWDMLPEFSSFWVEKSEDGGRTYKKAMDLPLLPILNADSFLTQPKQYWTDSVVNYHPVSYRILATTPFGEKCPPSTPVQTMGRDLNPPTPPFFVELKNIKDSSVLLVWQKDVMEPDFQGFRVERASKIDGPYQPLHSEILSPAASRYTDPDADYNGENFYRLIVSDTAGNLAASTPGYAVMIDTFAPARPTGLTGVIDKKGVVTLNWQRGAESDILGYRIFFANDATHTFSNLTGDPVPGLTFVDTVTLRTLSPRVYYQICAVDRHFNHSPRTDMISIARPDTIAPVRPVFSDVVVSDTVVYLYWVASNSEDAARQVIYRRPEQGEWSRIGEADNQVTSWQDRVQEKNRFYEYSIETIDENGNRSPKAQPVRARPYDSGVKPPVRAFQAVFNETNKQVELIWDTFNSQPGDYTVVYRGADAARMSALRSVDAGSKQFTDQSITKRGQYYYSIKIMDKSGRSTPMSPAIPVMVR